MTERFKKIAGVPVAQGVDDPGMLPIGDGDPNWVRTPEELGGQRCRVSEGFMAPCPMCEIEVRHLKLEGTNIHVAECAEHGFLWYKRNENN